MTRHRVLAAAVALTVAAVGVAVALQLSPKGEDVLSPTAPRATGSATTAGPAPSASASPSASALGTAAAVLADGRLVLISGDTGEILRHVGTTKVTRSDGFVYDGAVAMSPDATRIYLVESEDYCAPPTVEIDTATGTRRQVSTGRSPAVSPEGARIATVAAKESGCNGNGVRVADLRDGAERVITPTAADASPGDFFEDNAVVTDLAWLDDHRIALARAYEGAVSLLVVDLDDPDDTPALPMTALEVNAVERDPMGEVITEWDCCYPEHEQREVRRQRLDGRVTARTTAVAPVRSLSVDRRGIALYRAGTSRLLRWDGRSPARELRDDVLAVAW